MWLRFVFHVAKIGYLIDKIHFSPLKERKEDYSWPLLSMGISDIWFVFGFVKRSWLFYFWFLGSLGCEARRAFFYSSSLLYRIDSWHGSAFSLCACKKRDDDLSNICNNCNILILMRYLALPSATYCNILQHFLALVCFHGFLQQSSDENRFSKIPNLFLFNTLQIGIICCKCYTWKCASHDHVFLA